MSNYTNDIYGYGNDLNQDGVYKKNYSDGIYQHILSKYKFNTRTFNKPQDKWLETELGAIYSPDYSTIEISDKVKFTFGDDWDELVKATNGWLFSLDYEDYNYDYAYDYLKNKYFPMGGCSSFHKGNIRGRNYDWYKDWSSTFLVRTKATNDRYATIGICSGIGDNELSIQKVKSKKKLKLYEILPFMLLDGINEKGLIANINVCQIFNDNGEQEITDITDKENPAIPAVMFVRYILDYCATIDEVIDVVNTRNIFMANIKNFVEEFHFMVSDSTGRTIVIEYKNNQPIITEGENLIMTNYKLCEDTGTDYGAGYERANIVRKNLDTVIDAKSALDVMYLIKYTNAYESFKDESLPDEEKWYSECNSKGVYSNGVPFDLHQGVPYSEYAYIVSKMIEMYDEPDENIKRNNKNTWQTVHSIVYDPNNNKLLIRVQENENYIEKSLEFLN